MDLHLPINAIIGAVKRGKRIIIPSGSTIISPDDQLQIFTTIENTNLIQIVFNP